MFNFSWGIPFFNALTPKSVPWSIISQNYSIYFILIVSFGVCLFLATFRFLKLARLRSNLEWWNLHRLRPRSATKRQIRKDLTQLAAQLNQLLAQLRQRTLTTISPLNQSKNLTPKSIISYISGKLPLPWTEIFIQKVRKVSYIVCIYCMYICSWDLCHSYTVIASRILIAVFRKWWVASVHSVPTPAYTI